MAWNPDVKKEHTFTWKIKDFSLCAKKKGECFKSPLIRAKSLYDSFWYISLYPRGHKESNKGYMACFLNRWEKDEFFEVECEFKISISEEGRILHSNKSSKVFRRGEFFGWNDFWKNSKQLCDTNKALVVRCTLKSTVHKSPLSSESSGITSFDFDQHSTQMICRNLNSNFNAVMTVRCTGTLVISFSVQVFEDDIKITIKRTEDFKTMSAMCEISLLDRQGRTQISRQDRYFFETENPSVDNDIWVFPTFLRKSMLNSQKEKYLKHDCFTLKIKIAISTGSQTDSAEDKECYFDSGTLAVLEDMKRLYKYKFHSDVKLHVDGQIVKAHKSILSIRSLVFSAMFDSDMVEKETGSVTIPDMKAETVNSLLEYMYTGTVENFNYEIATKLILAANKYQVLALKEKCARFLKSMLTYENVCEVLVVADLIQHEVLKSAAISYIKEYSESIFFSAEWKHVLAKNLKLATETVSEVSKLIGANQNKTEN